MTKKQNPSHTLNRASVVKTGRSGSTTQELSRGDVAQSITPTSARIIKATSIKRRTAMKVLANR